MGIEVAFQPKFLGKPVKRVEDPILLTGRAQCTDDLSFPGMLHVAVLRSPHAHARIVSIDTSAAREVPGVELVVTGEDYRQHVGPMGGFAEGWQGYAIAVEKVRYVGEPVAVVVANSRYVAEDAAELIQVEYEPLPAVVDPFEAIKPDAPRLYEDKDGNVIYERNWTYGDPDRVLAEADLVVRGSFRFPRVSANSMETNGVVARYDPIAGEVTCWGGHQIPSMAQLSLAAGLGIPPNRVRVIAQPHGGSFGSRSITGKFSVVCAVLSKMCGGRPVKYIEDRLEHLLASASHAWDRHYEAEFGFTRDGRCTAMKIRLLNDIGASSEAGGPSMTFKPLVAFTGPYKVEHISYDVTAVVTNKCPEGGYRGYGPPPHVMVVERMMDKAAKELGLDVVEIRRRNFIQPDEFPWTTPVGHQYDSGNYPAVLQTALDLANYEELRREQERRRAEGKLVGISVVFGIEPGGAWGWSGPYRIWPGMGGNPMSDGATIRVDMTGEFQVDLFFPLEGQGQYTFATQLVADFFGVPMEMVRVKQAEPQYAHPAFGPGGSRHSVTLSWALIETAEKLKEKLLKVAAHLMEVAPEDLELTDGAVRIKGMPERAMPVSQIAATIRFRPDLLPEGVDGNAEVTHTWNAPGRRLDSDDSPYLTYANACHVVMVEIDPETGQVSIPKYVFADDCGTRLNPAVVEGIQQGGLAQGLGCALLEEYVYSEDGQPLTGTFMDYLLPSIYEVPMTEKAAVATPSPFTPLGVKGAGEGAIHTTPAAIFCAINDALAPLGVELTRVPATPDRLWRVIQSARQAAGTA